MVVKQLVGRAMVSATMVVVLGAGVGTAQASATPVRSAGTPTNATGVRPGVGSWGSLGPLTDLVIERLLVSDQVAASKFGTGQPIDDPVREAQELASVRQSAVSMGIDPDATVAFFQQQITASKVVQQGMLDRWTAHPDEAPTTRPDLTQIRTQLDQLTTELLDQLVAQRHLLSSGLVCQVNLVASRVTGEIINHLDALHRRALDVALASTCTA